MINNENDIKNIVDKFCLKNHYSSEMFEISKIAESATGGKNERLVNKTPVKNPKCHFVIKYYKQLDIVVIWNYSFNPNMSYSYKTIKEKLNNGIRYGDKGSEFHTKKQYWVYFDKGDRLSELLKVLINPI